MFHPAKPRGPASQFSLETHGAQEWQPQGLEAGKSTKASGPQDAFVHESDCLPDISLWLN